MSKAQIPATRIDPVDDGDSLDGDFQSEFALSGVGPNDKIVWATAESRSAYRGLRYRVVHHGEGIELRYPVGDEKEGDEIKVREHVLMVCDKAKDEKRIAKERKSNAERREAMSRKAQEPVVLSAEE